MKEEGYEKMGMEPIRSLFDSVMERYVEKVTDLIQ